MTYDQMPATELAELISALRLLEAEGLRHTAKEQSFIFRHISPQKLVEVLQLLNKQGGLVAVLSGEAPSKIEGR